MSYEKEMARYRSKLTKRSRKGRRQTDVSNPRFFTTGWILEIVFLVGASAWLLMACIKK